MPYDSMPMAAIINLECFDAYNSRTVLMSLREGDSIELLVSRKEEEGVDYKVTNLTMQQKYQDVKVYVGEKSDEMLNEEPRSMADKFQPINYSYPTV